jgi:anti-sigma regulatory factor (Ser/Thr protein kinase)/CheY-like chemotaxis protein
MGRVLVIGSDNPVTHTVVDLLTTAGVPLEFASGPVIALQRMRPQSFAVAITSPGTSMEEDLALLDEMRHIRPGIKCIMLAPHSSPQEIIAALRARVFACFTAPFDPQAIAAIACDAASGDLADDDIHVISARPGWVTVRANCRLITAERLMSFARELSSQMKEDMRDEILISFREIVLNAMEHGAAFNPEQMIEVTAVRSGRAFVFYVRDPGSGFRPGPLPTDRIANPAEGLIANLAEEAAPKATDDLVAHIRRREEEGLPTGGFGLLLARGTVDELLYNEIGNEVLLIKYIDRSLAPPIKYIDRTPQAKDDPLVH